MGNLVEVLDTPLNSKEDKLFKDALSIYLLFVLYQVLF